MAQGRAWRLALLLSALGVVFCSAEENDGGQEFGHPEGELSRSKRSPGGHLSCPCPGTHGFQKPRRPGWMCPCDHVSLSVLEQPHRHHHHRGTKRHLDHKRKQCRHFLRQCHLRQINIPL